MFQSYYLRNPLPETLVSPVKLSKKDDEIMANLNPFNFLEFQRSINFILVIIEWWSLLHNLFYYVHFVNRVIDYISFITKVRYVV